MEETETMNRLKDFLMAKLGPKGLLLVVAAVIVLPNIGYSSRISTLNGYMQESEARLSAMALEVNDRDSEIKVHKETIRDQLEQIEALEAESSQLQTEVSDLGKANEKSARMLTALVKEHKKLEASSEAKAYEALSEEKTTLEADR